MSDDYHAQAVHTAARMMLDAVGEDPEREGLADTPDRVARAWRELTRGYRSDPAEHLEQQFPEDYDRPEDHVGVEPLHGILYQQDIQFFSLCEHHLLPFFGHAHVAYIPDGGLVGLSKIARCVRGYAARLQVQERLTNQVANALVEKLEPAGVMVVLEARHLCMAMRGVRANGTTTSSSAVRGAFREQQATRAEALQLLGLD